MARERATDTSALVAAAAETFRRKGYRNSTIDDIADAAGISRPTVYRYTRSKQHLLDLMVDLITGELERTGKEILDSGDPAPVRLRRMVGSHLAAAAANRTFYAIVLSEEVELSEAGRARFRAWAHDRTREFRALLDESLAGRPRTAGSGARTLDTTVAANLLLTMLTSLYRWYDPAGPVSPADLEHQVILLLDGVLDGVLDRGPGRTAP